MHATKQEGGHDQSRKVRSSHRWTRFSIKFKKRYPFCLDPFGEHIHRLENTVAPHHIEKLRLSTEHAFNESMIVPVCRACHDRVENIAPTPRMVRWMHDADWRKLYWAEI
jgi:5-methylcytosine-specific restriction endonuclease McrA